jgi:hypothetical protein
MSAQTPFTASRLFAPATYLELVRHRLAAVRIGALALATAGALGTAPVSQARPSTDETASSTPADAPPALVTACVSPLRDTWYLDDQSTRPSAETAVSFDGSPRTHDDWMLP